VVAAVDLEPHGKAPSRGVKDLAAPRPLRAVGADDDADRSASGRSRRASVGAEDGVAEEDVVEARARETSASETLASVSPLAPAAICIRPIRGALCVLA
jgi:hypothetical protein